MPASTPTIQVGRLRQPCTTALRGGRLALEALVPSSDSETSGLPRKQRCRALLQLDSAPAITFVANDSSGQATDPRLLQ